MTLARLLLTGLTSCQRFDKPVVMPRKFLFILFLIVFLFFGIFNSAFASSVIFSDGFEEGFIEWTGNDEKWTTSGTSSATGVHSGLKRGQATGATETGDDVLLKNVSTLGNSTIKLEFWYRVYKGLENEDHVYVEWTPDGSNWNVLNDFTAVGESVNWEFTSYNFPIEANDKDNFAIRFRAHLGAVSSDIFYLDDVVVSVDGQSVQTTLTPTPTLVPTSSPQPKAGPPLAETATPVPSATKTPTPSPTPPTKTPTPLPSVTPSKTPTPVSSPIKTATSVPASVPIESSTPSTLVQKSEDSSLKELVASEDSGIFSASIFKSVGSKSFWLLGIMVLAVVFSLGKFKKN